MRTYEETQAIVLRWRQQGWSYAEIGRALGMSAAETLTCINGESQEPDPNEYLIELQKSAIRIRKGEPPTGPVPPRVEIQQVSTGHGTRRKGLRSY
jgi:hypothetical protein